MKTSTLLLVAAMVVAMPSRSRAQTTTLVQVTDFGSNPGGLRMWKYVPAGMPQNAPMVLALHACTQQAADYVKAGWNTLADKYKFYVVYPEQTSTITRSLVSIGREIIRIRLPGTTIRRI